MFFLCFFFLIIRRPPRSTRTDTLFPYTTLFRSLNRNIEQYHVPLLLSGRAIGISLPAAGPADPPTARPSRGLPILCVRDRGPSPVEPDDPRCVAQWDRPYGSPLRHRSALRSEEHTSELQSLMRISYAVFCLKKKKIKTRKESATHKYTTEIDSNKHNK